MPPNSEISEEFLTALYKVLSEDIPENESEILDVSENDAVDLSAKIHYFQNYDIQKLIEAEQALEDSLEHTKQLRAKMDSKEEISSDRYLAQKNDLLMQLDSARQELMEVYPEAKIYVMDSELVTALQGMLVKEAVKLRNQGIEMEEAVRRLEAVRGTGHIFFTTKDLKYLEHGGRIGKAASIAGSVLNIKPLLQYYDGELAAPEICRGRKRSLQKLLEMFLAYIEKEQINLEEYHLATGIGLPVSEYEPFKQQLREELKKRGYHISDWEEIQIGATIGVHTGPYPMGVAFLKRCQ